MHSFGPEIVFSDHEQQLGLPGRIARSDALGIADSLISGAFRLQADTLQQFSSQRSLPASLTQYETTPEPMPDMSHQLLSLAAYQRFAAGLKLAALVASEAVDVVEAQLRGHLGA